ncbi:MAG TPA: hypothetical protein DIU00_20320 [Phycisphaerales bacterium]|nr:hypothetical protein [Phycisphaerales bacterium]
MQKADTHSRIPKGQNPNAPGIKENLKTIGVVAITGGCVAVFIHLHYAKRLADYQRSIAGYELKVTDLQQVNQALLIEKNDLRTSLDEAEKEIAPAWPTGQQEQPNSQPDNLADPDQQEADKTADENIAYPLKLNLKKGEPQLLWSGFVRVTLGASYKGLENATLYFYFGSQEHRIDLWADRRETITVRGQTYWLDLLNNDDESATIAISEFAR